MTERTIKDKVDQLIFDVPAGQVGVSLHIGKPLLVQLLRESDTALPMHSDRSQPLFYRGLRCEISQRSDYLWIETRLRTPS